MNHHGYINTIKRFSQQIRSADLLQQAEFKQEKIQIYRQLVRNGFNDVVSPCFPVLSAILGQQQWQQLTHAIYSSQPLTNACYTTLAYQVVKYLQHTPLKDAPFAADLAHYEWLELEIMLNAVEEMHHSCPSSNTSKDLMRQPIQFSPNCRLLNYDYPVQRIDIGHQPNQTNPTFILAYLGSQQVEFIELNPLSHQLLSYLKAHQCSAQSMLESLIEMNPTAQSKQLNQELHELLIELHRAGVILA